MFPFPALLADIGGTNARFWLLAGPEAVPSAMVRLETAAHRNFADAVEVALARGGFPRPKSLLIGAAGPVRQRSVALTNASWLIEGPALADQLGLDQGILLNDFETLALALPALAPADLMAIGTEAPRDGLKLVIGPGTGLGVGALALAGGRFLPMPSEGGHIGFAAETAADETLWRRFDLGETRVQAEMLLAGPGLPRLHAALGSEAWVTAAEITERALGGEDGLAQETVRLWLALLARFSGDMALTFMATGGVYLAGGILPRVRALIDPGAFRQRFAHNVAHAAFLAGLPVHLITASEPAMIGLAALVRAPDRYLIDYPLRLWRV